MASQSQHFKKPTITLKPTVTKTIQKRKGCRCGKCVLTISGFIVKR